MRRPGRSESRVECGRHFAACTFPPPPSRTEMSSVSDVELEKLSATLLNTSGSVPLAKRFRALFTLKALAAKNEEALRIISKGTLRTAPI
jgi:hypothetical protein